MTDQFIKSKAAIAWAPKQPLSIEEVDVFVTPMHLHYQVKTPKAFFRAYSGMKAAV
jgi:Zn-dependent alcohol dehydrogenase